MKLLHRSVHLGIGSFDILPAGKIPTPDWAHLQLGLIAELSDNLEGTINNVKVDRLMATMMCLKATLVIPEQNPLLVTAR